MIFDKIIKDLFTKRKFDCQNTKNLQNLLFLIELIFLQYISFIRKPHEQVHRTPFVILYIVVEIGLLFYNHLKKLGWHNFRRLLCCLK